MISYWHTQLLIYYNTPHVSTEYHPYPLSMTVVLSYCFDVPLNIFNCQKGGDTNSADKLFPAASMLMPLGNGAVSVYVEKCA